MTRRAGRVALVGAGPGDPGLLTVRGRALLMRADAVVLDRLGTERLVELCRPGARLVDAGKAPGRAALTQDEINATLVSLAHEGLDVVRLKGGDPFVFGRGGEEVIALRRAGIPVEVVPGITSAIAAPAYAGIPVTHRAVARAFSVVTGHEDPAKGGEQTDWAALARVPGTLVILMGMGRLEAITAALVAGGRPASQPAAVVQWGTTDRQRQLVATLGALPAAVAEAGLGSPAVVVVGDVAGLADDVTWRGTGPLAGRTVVVTRARAQAGELADRLRALGARVVELPVIRVEPCHGPEVDRMVEALGTYRLIVLTSVNGVDQLFARLAGRGRDARALAADATVVAIGPATAERLRAHGVRADVVPERFVGEAVLEALAAHHVDGVPVLVARAREARDVIVEGLRARGAAVDEVALYETHLEQPGAEARAAAAGADWVTFTASSTVRNWREVMGADGIGAARTVSIGPVTSETMRELGVPVHAEAGEHTIPGLVDALLADAAEAAPR